MGEMENQAEFYYEKLKATTNPGKVIIEFSKELLGKDILGIILINKLIKLFGRFTVYFSVMDLSKSDRLEGNLYPLLYTICKSRFERIHNNVFIPAYEPLDKFLREFDKEKEKARKSKGVIPTSEGL